MDKLLVILGPTASGKTQLAVQLAFKYNTEIISADSRQVYKNMDIGTGKDLYEYEINNVKIPYHLIDIINPQQDYSVYQFKNDFKKTYKTITSSNKVPILCGGTGFYIESILLNYQMPETKPNYPLREILDKQDIEELKKTLIQLDQKSFDENYHTSKRRLIRSIEILKDNKPINMNDSNNHNLDNTLIIGIDIERSIILERIKKRLDIRLKEGMIDEVEALVKSGISYDRLNYFGLEYKFIGKYLSDEIKYDEMKILLNNAINKFAKRQMTFFRRMEKRGIKINWLNSKNITKIDVLINDFLDVNSI